ncbi:MAG TPA: lipopolysaccharide biosynthesis protein [Gemmatimonadaceae bacterium]|nr:lipopolysaccharide biosynthesis protein [Gemmatimonadaceae bacterium]
MSNRIAEITIADEIVNVPPPRTDTQSLDRSLVSGIAWTGGMKWATQILSWAATLVVARILSPADYGLMGMAAVYLGLVTLINEFGLTAAILRHRELSEDQIARVGGFSLLVGIAIAGISVALAPLIARFYAEPAVATIIAVLSLNFVFGSLGVLPRSLLARDLSYPRLAMIDGITNIAQMATMLLFAIAGYRYMALVFGSLVGSGCGALLALWWRPHRLVWPSSLRAIGDTLHVGWHIVVGRLAWYTYNTADFAVVGRVLGKQALGAYTLGWEIATMPVERISALVSSVTPGVFSAVQHDIVALRRYFLGVVEGLAFITLPAAAGLALIAGEFVPVVLGSQWQAAVLPLRLLAVYGGIRSIDTVTPQVLIYTGHSRQSMWYSLIAACVMPVLFVVGTRWGAAGVAAVWIVAYPAVVAPQYRLAFRVLDLRAGAYFRTLWPALSSTAVMAAAVGIALATLPETMAPVVRLVIEVAVGVAVYAGMIAWRHRARASAFVAILREHAL